MIVVIGKAYTCKCKIFEKRTNLCNIIFSQTAESSNCYIMEQSIYLVMSNTEWNERQIYHTDWAVPESK